MTSDQPRSTAQGPLQRMASSRVVSICNLVVAPILVYGALFGRSNPGPPFDNAFFVVTGKLGKLLLAAFLIHYSIRNLRARGAAAQGQQG